MRGKTRSGQRSGGRARASLARGPQTHCTCAACSAERQSPERGVHPDGRPVTSMASRCARISAACSAFVRRSTISGSVGIGVLLVSETVIGSFTSEEPIMVPTRERRSGLHPRPAARHGACPGSPGTAGRRRCLHAVAGRRRETSAKRMPTRYARLTPRLAFQQRT